MIEKNINKKVKHKKAFSMVTAIFTIVIMATVTSLIMSLVGKTIHETSAQYQKEQATILARSYTELAILYAIHKAANGNCMNQIDAKFGENRVGDYDPSYKITVNIQYAGNDTNIDNACNSIGANGRWTTTTNNGFDSTVSLLIDVYVSYRDMNHPANINSDTTDDVLKTFHRRTLQRI